MHNRLTEKGEGDMTLRMLIIRMTVLAVMAVSAETVRALPLWDFQNLTQGLSYSPERGFLLWGANSGFSPKPGGLHDDPDLGGRIDAGRSYVGGLEFQDVGRFGALTQVTLGGGLLAAKDNEQRLALAGYISPGGKISIDAAGNAHAALTFTPLRGWLAPDFQMSPNGVPLVFDFVLPAIDDVWSTSFSSDFTGRIGATPEPTTFWLLCAGLLGFGIRQRRRQAGK